ncbi:MAG: hypothetical protein U0R50_11855 [Gaiellales bacterium]
MSTHETTYRTTYDPDVNQVETPDDEWDDVPITPRARLSKVTKLLALLAVALAAFAGGIFAQRQWGAGASSGGGLPGRATLPSFGAGGTNATGEGAAAAGFGGLTIGEVEYIKGNTLYVTDTNGNTVKVAVPKGTRVSKSVTTNLRGVHPGDNVVVTGSKSSNGTVRATNVSIGGTGLGGAAGGAAGFGNGGGASGFGGSGGASGFGGGASDSGNATGFGGSSG